jgi:hypothetical protein
MKNCSCCGHEYADDMTVCPLDGQPVINQERHRKKITTPPAATQTAFNAKLITPIFSAGTYRIFVERSDLLFIQIEGGSKSILAATAPLLGPAGNLIPLGLWLFTKKKAKDRLQNVDQQNPEDRLRESEQNFKLHLSEIRDASIEPPTLFAASGKAGRLHLLVRHGEKFKFEFENAVEMNKAIHLLAPLLNSTLKVNVEWNEEKRRFEKKKTV